MTPERKAKLDRVATNRQKGLTVVLENISDPHNANAIVRSCDAFGITDVHLIFDNEEHWNRKDYGRYTSAGAQKWVDLHEWDSPKACIEHLKGEGFEVIGTMIDPDAEPLIGSDMSAGKIALVFGNERHGISDAMKALIDRKLYIRMRGMAESFNLSVSAAMIIFEITRQRVANGMDEFLYKGEELETLFNHLADK